MQNTHHIPSTPQTFKPSHLIVVTLVMSVLLALVGGSLYNTSDVQALGDDKRYGNSNTENASQGVIMQHITSQKTTLSDWIEQQFAGLEKKGSDMVSSGSALLNETLADNKIISTTTQSFKTLQVRLAKISCDNTFVVDAAQARNTDVIKRGLEKCLITPSHSSKANPQDFLTHATLRVMAERAGFDVKQEYASDDLVSKSEFIGFLNDLQSQANFGSLPVISYGDHITREQFLHVLYKIFEKDYDGLGLSPSLVSDIVAIGDDDGSSEPQTPGFNTQALNNTRGSLKLLFASL